MIALTLDVWHFSPGGLFFGDLIITLKATSVGGVSVMMIAWHKNAATTPAIRRKIAQSDDPVAVLAMRYSVSEDTVRKWKKRDSFEDRSHTAHRLQTTLTPAQEIVVVELRRVLLLPLDDLLAITREFLNPDGSRSGL